MDITEFVKLFEYVNKSIHRQGAILTIRNEHYKESIIFECRWGNRHILKTEIEIKLFYNNETAHIMDLLDEFIYRINEGRRVIPPTWDFDKDCRPRHYERVMGSMKSIRKTFQIPKEMLMPIPKPIQDKYFKENTTKDIVKI